MHRKRILSSYLFLVFVGLMAFPQASYAQSQGAVLYFEPSSQGTFSSGGEVWVDIMVDTKGQDLNAAAAYFSYPEDQLESLGVNTEGSVMTLFSERIAEGGMVKVSGGKPTPGFTGVQKIASVGFRAKSDIGYLELTFSEKSALVTNEGSRNVLDLEQSGTFRSGTPPTSDQAPASTSGSMLLLVGVIIAAGVVVIWFVMKVRGKKESMQ